MKKWFVDVPFTGYVTVEVEAETEKEAQEKGIEKAMDVSLVLENKDSCDYYEYEFTEQVVKGNVCYAVKWEIEAEEVETA